MLASYCASLIVYQEGLSWVSSINEKDRYSTIMTYMKSNQSVHKLMKQVDQSKIPQKDEIMMILEKSAAKNLAVFELENAKKKKP